MSAFIISLDLELYWGVCGSKELEDYKKNLLGVESAVSGMLKLFNDYGIRATWATVGFLFHDCEEQREKAIPQSLPKYPNSRDETFGISQDLIKANPQCFYLPGVLEALSQANQEIGSHSYSHFYSLENENGDQCFEEDTLYFQQVSKPYSQALSYVFPRNQVKESHLPILLKSGIKTFRGNDANRIYEKKDILSRLIRFADSYLPLQGAHSISAYLHQSGLVNVPASTFLRPHNPKWKFLNHLQLRRIKKAMSRCAKSNESYHLWWHPHNFGVNLPENLNTLKEILAHYSMLKEKYGMANKTMGDFSNLAS